MMHPGDNLTDQIRDQARHLGFDRVGICPAIEPPGLGHLHTWLDRGYAGQMHYFDSRRDAYAHPHHVLDPVRSIVMLATNYRTDQPADPLPAGKGRVARYAWGESDYHDIIHDRLKQLATFCRAARPECHVRGVVDTAPLMEHAFAQLAGLGWIGKNTLLLDRDNGSYFFLAALLTDLELQYDAPHAADHCGTCTACLDACPTDAFPEPYVLDARKCISYLTIELREPIEHPLRTGMGNWLFGCDICQEVCPWNNRAPQTDEMAFQPRPDQNPVELASLFDLDDESFRQRFRKTPLARPKRRGLLRNAAIVLGNQKDASAIDALIKGLNDHEPIVRGSAAWALGQIGTPMAIAALRERLEVESDASVREEIETSLK